MYITAKCFDYNLNLKSIKILPVFEKIQRAGNLELDEMFHVFNMGVGMVLISSPDNADKILNNINNSYVIGEVVKGDNGILLI